MLLYDDIYIMLHKQDKEEKCESCAAYEYESLFVLFLNV